MMKPRSLIFPISIASILIAGCSSGASPIEPDVTQNPPSPSQTSAVKVMPLGDSITQADSQHDSYRRPLWLDLKSAGFNVDFVGTQRSHHRGPAPNQDFDMDHEGHWGWRADEVLDHIAEWAQDELPDIVLIHLGTNDVLESQPTASTLGELGQIIDRIRFANPEVHILLAQLIPVDGETQNARIRSLNREIPNPVSAKNTKSSPVTVVDQFSGFEAHLDTYDGLHPNPSGEEKIARNWFIALENLLSSNE
jgi:lysophospholipase L1-like esterase